MITTYLIQPSINYQPLRPSEGHTPRLHIPPKVDEEFLTFDD